MISKERGNVIKFNIWHIQNDFSILSWPLKMRKIKRDKRSRYWKWALDYFHKGLAKGEAVHPQRAMIMKQKGQCVGFIKPPKDSTKVRLKGVCKGTKKVCHSMSTFNRLKRWHCRSEDRALRLRKCPSQCTKDLAKTPRLAQVIKVQRLHCILEKMQP